MYFLTYYSDKHSRGWAEGCASLWLRMLLSDNLQKQYTVFLFGFQHVVSVSIDVSPTYTCQIHAHMIGCGHSIVFDLMILSRALDTSVYVRNSVIKHIPKHFVVYVY